MYSDEMYGYGAKSSVIRSIFSYSQARAKVIGRENLYDFSLGNPSVPAPQEVQEAFRSLLNEMKPLDLHGYTAGPGDMNVRNVIAQDLNERFGTDVTGEHIYMTCGAAAALKIAMTALYEEGDEIIVPMPYFPEYEVFAKTAGYKFVPVPGEHGTLQPDVDAIEAAITDKTKILLLNSPNNPSGAIYKKEKLQQIAKVLAKKNAETRRAIYILSDEPYRELAYDMEVPFIPRIYKDTIVAYSFSKSFSIPGERIGYICVQPEADHAQEVYTAVCGAGRALGYVCAPSFLQQVVARCIKAQPDLAVYRENRDVLYTGLTKAGYECVHPDGAFYLMVKAPDGDTERFFERAKKHEVLVVPAETFGAPGYVRLSYCVDPDMVRRSIPLFEMIMESYRQ